VDTNAFSRLRADFLKSPGEKWGAIVCSVAAALTYPLLLLLLYLFVDLLVWKGTIPSYASLSTAKKQEFANEWAARSNEERRTAVLRVRPNAGFKDLLLLSEPEDVVAKPSVAPADTATVSPYVWEVRWRAGAYLALRDRVSEAAGDTLVPPPGTPADYWQLPKVGILSLVVRDRTRWTGEAVGWLASWNRWTWRPGTSGSANETYLAGLFILASAVALIRGVLLNATAYLAATATLDTVTRLRRAVYFHTYRLGSLAVRPVGSAEAVTIATRRIEAVGDAIYAWLTTTFRYPVKFTLLLVLILAVNFWLAVSFLLLAALVWVIGGQIAAYFRREGRMGTRQAEAQLALMQESIGLLRLVKCFQMERFNQSRVERQLSESARGNWRRLRGEALSRPLLVAVGLLAGVALMYLAARSVLAGDFTVAGLVVMAVALASLVEPLAGWVRSLVLLRRGREAAAAIFEFLDRKGDAAEAADAEYLPPLTTRMEFRAVTLKEPGTGRAILDNLTFAIPAGTRVALVGPDPVEKRALVYLIPRFLDPTAGELRVEDKNIRWVTHESLRAQVALVMQDDLVFSDTVLNNIGCGDPGYTLPQIIEAAKLAHAHQFIEKLPYGYETMIGDHGHPLRPGERFRIALARALLRDPSILVIEEPTGPIDDDTLALLDDTLERVGHGRTVIFLAQRLSTLRGVDRVFLIRDGRLEASGSHRDLRQTNEAYRRLPIVADATGPEPAPAQG
jgi:ABC-type multidrug transport system fused ATPase/permease subunit